MAPGSTFLRVVTRIYRRTPDEVALVGEVMATARQLGPLKGMSLLRLAAATQFLPMSFVEAVIHYDLPLSSRAFAERVGRYRSYGPRVACTAYCFEDETRALQIEAIQLQIARVPDIAPIEVDTDVHALFERVLA